MMILYLDELGGMTALWMDYGLSTVVTQHAPAQYGVSMAQSLFFFSFHEAMPGMVQDFAFSRRKQKISANTWWWNCGPAGHWTGRSDEESGIIFSMDIVLRMVIANSKCLSQEPLLYIVQCLPLL